MDVLTVVTVLGSVFGVILATGGMIFALWQVLTKYLDARLETMNTKLDAYGGKLEAQAAKLDAFGDKLDVQGAKLDAFGDKLDVQGAKLDMLLAAQGSHP